jgi:hypothetical protein
MNHQQDINEQQQTSIVVYSTVQNRLGSPMNSQQSQTPSSCITTYTISNNNNNNNNISSPTNNNNGSEQQESPLSLSLALTLLNQ